MKKLLFVFLGTFITFEIDAQSGKYARGHWMARNLFSIKNNEGLSSEYEKELGKLLVQVWNQTVYEDVYSARKAIKLLEIDRISRVEALKNIDESKKIALETSIFIIQQQQDALNEQANLLIEKLTFKDKIYGFLHNFYKSLVGFFGKIDNFTISDTALNIYKYARFERERLFVNYQATLEWFSVQKKIGFPTLIYFWKNKKIHHLLLCRLKQQAPHIVLLSALLDAAGEELIDIGAGDTLETLEVAETNVDEAIAAGIAEVFGNSAVSGTENITVSAVMETNIDSAIANAAAEVPAGSLEAEALTDLNSAVQEIIASPSSGAGVLSKLWDGVSAIKNSLVNAYDGSFVGKAMKFIGDMYDQFIEAPYKKYIYDYIIKPLENNPLNKALSVLPHWIKMPIDMLIQLCTMQGGGLVSTWVSSANAAIFSKDAAANTVIAEDFKNFSLMLQAQQAIVQTNGQNVFYNALAGYVANQKAISDVAQAQLSIVSKSLLQQSSQQSYSSECLSGFYQADEIFSLSPMFNTPTLAIPKQTVLSSTSSKTGPVLPLLGAWHNLYSVGNWECIANKAANQISYAFYQIPPVVPLGKPSFNNSNSTSSTTTSLLASASFDPDQALSNSIFTEYYPATRASYQISVNFEILSVTYPFFVGILFNKARLISGIANRSYQQRYAGLYGAIDGTVYLVIIESVNSSAAQITQGYPAVQSPFYLVATTPSSSFTNSFTQVTIIPTPSSIATSPLVIPGNYTIAINTDLQEVIVTLTDQKKPGTAVQLKKQNLNPNVFNFHGIGLVSAGASSSFVIEKPYALGLSTPISQ